MKQKVLTAIGVLILPLLGCAPDGGSVDRDLDMHANSLVSRDLAVNIESHHPYENDSREVFQVSAPQGAVNLTIHFDRLQVEEGYDYVLVYDGDSHLIRAITGHKDGENVLVNSPSAYIVMWSDGSVTDYGFVVNRISYSIVAPDPHPTDPVPADVGQPCEHRMPAGSECVEGAYCASDDVCREYVQCAADSDCSNPNNPWVHDVCEGEAHCIEGVCNWQCTSPDPQPTDPVPADVGQPCEHRMPAGSECVEGAYCASDDVCHADGQCVVDSDCEISGNAWVHVMCTPGEAHCNNGSCAWECTSPDPQPSDPVPADVGQPCEHRMPAGSECVEGAYCASDDVCHADGQCVVDSDCLLLGNTWNHPMCTGTAYCSEGTCAWQCTSPDPQPSEPVWSWTRIMADGIESAHPYANDYVHTWTIHRDGAAKIRLHFSKIDMEEGYDYIVIRGTVSSETIRVDGYYEDVWTPEFTGDTVSIEIHTDYSVTKWGFEVDYAEYYEQLPQGHCNTDDDCSDGQTCHQVMCVNPYEACYGECRAQ